MTFSYSNITYFFSDHLVTTRHQHHRSRKWYLTVVFHRTLSWAAVNATIIYQEHHPSFVNCEAKEEIAQQLTDWLCPGEGETDDEDDELIEEEPLVPQQPSEPPIVADSVVKAHRRNRRCHHSVGFVSNANRQVCVAHLQKKKVDTFCKFCGKFLCIKSGCFDNFHNRQQYLMDDPTMQNSERRRNIKVW